MQIASVAFRAKTIAKRSIDLSCCFLNRRSSERNPQKQSFRNLNSLSFSNFYATKKAFNQQFIQWEDKKFYPIHFKPLRLRGKKKNNTLDEARANAIIYTDQKSNVSLALILLVTRIISFSISHSIKIPFINDKTSSTMKTQGNCKIFPRNTMNH